MGSRCIPFLRASFKSLGSHMPPHSLLLHSCSYRPLRNTFRSIDFAVDTQAVGTERRRSRKSARVKGGETGARLARGRGRRREGEHIGRKGKKRNATAETRSRNKRVARVERGTEVREENQREKGKTETENARKEKRERMKGRKKKECWRPEVRETERRRGRPRSTTYLPMGGGEERLVCSGLHHPREPTPGRQPPLFFQRSFHHPLFPHRVSRRYPSSSLLHIKHIFPGRPSVVFLSSAATGKQIHPGEGGESHPAVVLARAAL